MGTGSGRGKINGIINTGTWNHSSFLSSAYSIYLRNYFTLIQPATNELLAKKNESVYKHVHPARKRLGIYLI